MISKIEETFGITVSAFFHFAQMARKEPLEYLKSEIVRYNAQDFADDTDKITPEWAEELFFEVKEADEVNHE